MATQTGYPGERLGLPKEGPGSLVGFGRRFLAVSIDWFIALGLSSLVISFDPTDTLARYPTVVVEVLWITLGIVGVRLFGFTSGQLIMGVRVASVDNRQNVGMGRATVRTLLVAFVVPPLFVDSDGRGIQDRVTNTAVVRR